jgi:CheY-like chemotaxis protein
MQLGQDETILVVEDNDIARQALVDTLQFLNYQTIEAKNGREALTILTNTVHDIRLILSDVTMPNMGGIALFQSLQEHDLMIPVLLLTGHPMGQEIESLQAQGLAGWLPKPPNIEKLAQLVTAALQK